MRRRGVGPGVPQRFETGALVGNGAQQIKQVTGRPRQAIQAGDHQHIILTETGDRRANCFRSAFAPLIFSWKISVQPAAFSSATCAVRDCPSVDTLP
jgi:hypothetical protein